MSFGLILESLEFFTISVLTLFSSQSSGRGKRTKSNEMEEKPREVVHVRAKRGQATDSHSLAERVRVQIHILFLTEKGMEKKQKDYKIHS